MKINSGSKQQKRLEKKGTAQGCNENEGKRKTYTNWRDKSGTKSHTRIHFASFSSNDIRRQLLTTLTFACLSGGLRSKRHNCLHNWEIICMLTGAAELAATWQSCQTSSAQLTR